MDPTWTERLFDSYTDYSVQSLIALGLGIVLFGLVYVGYFRNRLEQAITDMVSPNTVRIEAASVAISSFATCLMLSRWGFALIGSLLIVAFLGALVSKGRWAIGITGVLLVALVIITILGVMG